jgi:hypothetical protein
MRDPVDRLREIHRLERVKIQGGNLAVEDLTFGTRLIVRTDRKTVWIADPMSGTYSELTFDRITARRREVIAEIVAAKNRVAGSADEERLIDLLKGLGEYPAPPKVEVRPMDRREEVAGRACVGREIVIDGDIHYIDVLVDPTLSDALAYFDVLGAIGAYPREVAEGIKGLGGFPLKGTVRYGLFLDRIKSEEEAISVKREAIPAADFELPAGLKRIPLKGFDPEDGLPEKPKDFTRSFKEDDVDRENNPLRDEKKDPPK